MMKECTLIGMKGEWNAASNELMIMDDKCVRV